MKTAAELWAAFLDLLLGARCPLCSARTFPKDRAYHAGWDHADEDVAW